MCINSDKIKNNHTLPHQQTTQQTCRVLPAQMKVLSTYKRISLWLLPPEPILSSLSHTQQQLIALEYNRNNRIILPSFLPHVTLLGGVPISDCCTIEDDVAPLLLPPSHDDDCWKNSDDNDDDGRGEQNVDEVAAKSVLRRLARAFRNFGGVDCKFVKERGVFAARRRREVDGSCRLSNGDAAGCDNNDEEGEVQWNQSCVSILERTDQFMNAVELADQVLFTKQSTANNIEKENGQSTAHLERYFKPPACEPHYSYVYGNGADLVTSLQPSLSSSSRSRSSFDSTGMISSGEEKTMVLECPPNFTSTEIAVFWTYPSHLDSVEEWREIGRFSLVEGVASKY